MYVNLGSGMQIYKILFIMVKGQNSVTRMNKGVQKITPKKILFKRVIKKCLKNKNIMFVLYVILLKRMQEKYKMLTECEAPHRTEQSVYVNIIEKYLKINVHNYFQMRSDIVHK